MTPIPSAAVFDLVGGLPLHVLVVHAAVVLLPLAALGVIALVAVPRLRSRYSVLTLVAVVVAGVAVRQQQRACGFLLASS